jgi:hypothetical protein
MPAHLGLDVAGFLAEMQRALGPLLAAPPGEEPAYDPDARPRVSARGEQGP